MTQILFNSVSKLLKRISTHSISYEGKLYIYRLIYILTEKILTLSIKLCKRLEKKTLDEKILNIVLGEILTGGLLSNSIKEGNSGIKLSPDLIKYYTALPSSFFKNYVKTHNIQDLMISKKYYTYLLFVIEYLTYEILDLSRIQCLKKDKKQIYPRDIFLAIQYDEELRKLCKKCNIVILGAGIFSRNLEPTKLQEKEKSELTKKSIYELSGDKYNITNDGTKILQNYLEYWIIAKLQKWET